MSKNVKKPTGFIYVLTNESFNRADWIKIGYSDNVEKRVKELSNTSLPLPFEVFCTYEIPKLENTKNPDMFIHDLIGSINPKARISEKREFFELDPNVAFSVLEAIATMHGRKDKLQKNRNNKYAVDPEHDEAETCSKKNIFEERQELKKLYKKIILIATSLDASLNIQNKKYYVAIQKNNHTVLRLFPKNGWIEVVLAAKREDRLNDPAELTYDISNRLWSSCQYALKLDDETNLDEVRKLVEQTIKKK